MRVKKRSGEEVPFDPNKIRAAVSRAVMATQEAGEVTYTMPLSNHADTITEGVIQRLTAANGHASFPIESIQDTVERALMEMGYVEVAKRYILYRNERARMRQSTQDITDLAEFEETTKYISSDLEVFQFLNKFARFRDDLGRRESWPEAVDRVVSFMKGALAVQGKGLHDRDWGQLTEAMLNRAALPATRLLQMAGPALDRCHVGVYACAYTTITRLRDFAESLYILMQGSGLSFSVEHDFIEELPKIKRQRRGESKVVMIVPDTTEGWCDALLDGLEAWFDGRDVEFDYSRIRPAGAKLKTKGGTASGPAPLKDLLDFTREVVLSRQGRRLLPIHVYDILCKIGKIVQVGGVRRAAELSLSDLDDTDMRDAKRGEFWSRNNQRTMCNNSVAYNEKPSATEFMEEWLALAKSGTGERGFMNRQGMLKTLPKRRLARIKETFGPTLARRILEELGVNACAEINLISKQFCNLTIAVIRPGDTWEEICEKVRLATIMGTIQSAMTRFNYLYEDWKHNCEAERLLGVDIPGAADHVLLRYGTDDRVERLEQLRQIAIDTNQVWAENLDIPPSTATTCAKPGGDSGVFLGVGHTVAGWNTRYIKRHVRVNAMDPMSQFLIDVGVPHWPEYDDPNPQSPSTWVFAFPLQAPADAWINDQVSAIQMLEQWLVFKQHYTEHNPSVTIYVKPEEWVAVGNWVYEHWDQVSDLSFFPRSEHVYPLAPITPLTKEEYEQFVATFPEVPWGKFPRYEVTEFNRDIARSFQCVGEKCVL